MAVSCMTYAFAAPTEETTNDYKAEYGGVCHVNWDSIYVTADRSDLFPGTKDGKITDYIEENGDVLTVDKALEGIYFWGWVVGDQDIIDYGYSIDGADVVYEKTNVIEAEKGVMDVAAQFGGHGARFYLHVDLNGLTKGDHEIKTYVKFDDESEFEIINNDGTPMTVTYRNNDPASPDPTEAPKATEAPAATEAQTATEAPTVTEVPAETEAPAATEEQPEATAAPAAETPQQAEKKGCNSTFAFGAVAIIAISAVIATKKEER